MSDLPYEKLTGLWIICLEILAAKAHCFLNYSSAAIRTDNICKIIRLNALKVKGYLFFAIFRCLHYKLGIKRLVILGLKASYYLSFLSGENRPHLFLSQFLASNLAKIEVTASFFFSSVFAGISVYGSDNPATAGRAVHIIYIYGRNIIKVKAYSIFAVFILAKSQTCAKRALVLADKPFYYTGLTFGNKSLNSFFIKIFACYPADAKCAFYLIIEVITTAITKRCSSYFSTTDRTLDSNRFPGSQSLGLFACELVNSSDNLSGKVFFYEFTCFSSNVFFKLGSVILPINRAVRVEFYSKLKMYKG